MFFDSAGDVGRVLAMGVMAYTLMVVAVRISGKRTLAKMNAFDLIVTVALGSTLATILLSSEVSLAEGVAAFALLVVAQALVAWVSVRAAVARRLVKAEPVFLFDEGAFCHSALLSERVTESEVLQAVRSTGIGGLDSVGAVVLETDGNLSVIPGSKVGSGTALADVRHR
jgi:uncharacterized membrane protein YcaP (DUF421 family)